MAEGEMETGMPERLGKVIGDVIAALIVLAVPVMMVEQFA